MNKKALIIFHSVSANTFLLAQAMEASLSKAGFATKLARVEDHNFEKFSIELHTPEELKNKILATSTITDPKETLAYDFIFMGCPTYFGNISGAMKCFLDGFSPLFLDASLFGKRFASFTTASGPTGGGDMCLLGLNNFAMHLGMSIIPIPMDVHQIAQPAYGFAHFSGSQGDIPPAEDMQQLMDAFANRLLKL